MEKSSEKKTGKTKDLNSKERQSRLARELKRQAKLLSEDVDFLWTCFNIMDVDKKGLIDPPQMRHWLTFLNEGDVPDDEDMRDVYRKVQKVGLDHTGIKLLGLAFQEFLVIVQDYYMGLGASHMRNIFTDMITDDSSDPILPDPAANPEPDGKADEPPTGLALALARMMQANGPDSANETDATEERSSRETTQGPAEALLGKIGTKLPIKRAAELRSDSPEADSRPESSRPQVVALMTKRDSPIPGSIPGSRTTSPDLRQAGEPAP